MKRWSIYSRGSDSPGELCQVSVNVRETNELMRREITIPSGSAGSWWRWWTASNTSEHRGLVMVLKGRCHGEESLSVIPPQTGKGVQAAP